MKSIFKKQVFDPRQGLVMIDGQRYLLIRAEAISHDFFLLLRELFPNEEKEEAELFAAQFVYDFGCNLGKTDRIFYTQKLHIVC